MNIRRNANGNYSVCMPYQMCFIYSSPYKINYYKRYNNTGSICDLRHKKKKLIEIFLRRFWRRSFIFYLLLIIVHVRHILSGIGLLAGLIITNSDESRKP